MYKAGIFFFPVRSSRISPFSEFWCILTKIWASTCEISAFWKKPKSSPITKILTNLCFMTRYHHSTFLNRSGILKNIISFDFSEFHWETTILSRFYDFFAFYSVFLLGMILVFPECQNVECRGPYFRQYASKLAENRDSGAPNRGKTFPSFIHRLGEWKGSKTFLWFFFALFTAFWAPPKKIGWYIILWASQKPGRSEHLREPRQRRLVIQQVCCY